MHRGVQNADLSYRMIKRILERAGIEEVCLFALVDEIYDRDDVNFPDTEKWQETRSKANRYLKDLSKKHPAHPYYFVWNDFNAHELTNEVKGVKWHRHSDESIYHYDDTWGCSTAGMPRSRHPVSGLMKPCSRILLLPKRVT